MISSWCYRLTGHYVAGMRHGYGVMKWRRSQGENMVRIDEVGVGFEY